MKKYIYIALGAMIGASLRFLISFGTAAVQAPFFTGSFAVNMIGAFLVGILISRLKPAEGCGNDFLLTGLLGSFTTFSMLTYEQYMLLSLGEYIMFFIYLAINLLGGLTLFAFGYKIGGTKSK